MNNPENTEAHESSSEATIGEKSNGVKYAECGCLLRQPPPGHPSVFPIPCSDKNIEEIKKWLVNRYVPRGLGSLKGYLRGFLLRGYTD